MTHNFDQLIQQFDAAMRGIIAQAASLPTPVKFTRLLQMVERHGGREAANIVLADSKIGQGLTNLALSGNENLIFSVEYLVQQAPWNQLFTDQQLAIAARRVPLSALKN
ncbi:hypothetical protein [Alcaligenes ammonioxydans]|uniref:hypothetical protein n=1 Tax=Alcaligenes ammonioxydans TaxID=2582914 RepID=UPI003D1D7D9F